jgi:hypothetical protein
MTMQRSRRPRVPQSTFAADGTQFIDGVSQSYAPAGFWWVGTGYLGGSKSFVRRSLASFDVYGPAVAGRPLTPSDTVTAAELLLSLVTAVGLAGWSATIDRVARADWDYASADWTHYKAGGLWTTPGGDAGTPPAPVTMTASLASEQVVPGMLGFVTDAMALRSGRVLLRVRAVNEAPADSTWVSYDAALTSPARPRLRVTYVATEPSPIAHEAPPTMRGARAVSAADAARPARSADVARTSVRALSRDETRAD